MGVPLGARIRVDRDRSDADLAGGRRLARLRARRASACARATHALGALRRAGSRDRGRGSPRAAPVRRRRPRARAARTRRAHRRARPTSCSCRSAAAASSSSASCESVAGRRRLRVRRASTSARAFAARSGPFGAGGARRGRARRTPLRELLSGCGDGSVEVDGVAADGLQRPHEATGAHGGRGILVERCRRAGSARRRRRCELLSGRPRSAATRRAASASAESASRRCAAEFAQGVAVERRLGRAQAGPERERVGDDVGLRPHQLVDQPGRGRRFRQRGDGIRQFAVVGAQRVRAARCARR